MAKHRSALRTASRIVPVNDENVTLLIDTHDFIISQTSIVSSVQLEPGSDHLITPYSAYLVNANGDTWSNESLKANYSSFRGGYSFVNHVQEHDKSVGFICDAVLRRIVFDDPTKYVFYVDLLIANHKDFLS